MNRIIYFFLILTLVGCSSTKSEIKKPINKENNIKIEINKNIETIGIILNLSFVGDFILEHSRKGRNYEFTRLIRKEFEEFKNHKAVKNFDKIKDNKLAIFGYYYYGLAFSELPEMKQIHPKFDDFFNNKELSKNEIDSILKKFDTSIREFYIDANLNDFFTENNEIYNSIIQEAKTAIPNNIISVMENYFGNYKNDYIIIPSPTIPVGWNFGPEIKNEGRKTFYYVTGPAYDLKPKRESFKQITKKDSLGFDNSRYYRELAIHEFGHSFIRFIDKKENVELYESLSYLNNEQLKKNFKKIGEGTEWRTIFEEHLVRANEIMIWKEMGNEKMANEKLKYEFNKEGILYIKDFVNALEKYRLNKKNYNSFELFFPELINELKTIKKQ